MCDREKVIGHIADCVHIADRQMNKAWVFVRTDILRDALELLKEQEPRVMTVDEMNQLSNGDTVWVEISDGRLLPMMVEDGTLMRWGYMWRICDEAFCAHEEGECVARAWTSRPTDEQREAIRWN